MKRTFFLLALMGLFISVQGQTQEQPESNPNAPAFQFEEEVHDFGEVPEGPNAVTEFKFKNVGNEPLIITNAKASCGCTVPKWPREPILPGQEEMIKVSYTTKGRTGAINKTITITSNASTPTKLLRITGKVIPAAAATGSPEKKPNMLEVKPQH
jgi:hypothetical protein